MLSIRVLNVAIPFCAATVSRVPEMFDKLAGKARPEQGRGSNLDSPRDLVMTFQDAAGRRDFRRGRGAHPRHG